MRRSHQALRRRLFIKSLSMLRDGRAQRGLTPAKHVPAMSIVRATSY